MARLKPNIKRVEGSRKLNLGRILLFCEGYTEYHYFDYFAKIINSNENKYSDIQIRIEVIGANSRTVLNEANAFLERDNNASQYHNYEKYLIFDCDDPTGDGAIQNVINDMVEEQQFKLLPTMKMFEIWLLMHFNNVETRLTKTELLNQIDQAIYPHQYEKNSQGIIRNFLSDTSQVEKAIDNAKRLETRYEEMGLSYLKNIEAMDPYTKVYELVETILMEIQ